MPDTINTLELGWTIYTGVGAIIAAWLATDVVRDIFDRKLMAGDEVRQQAAILCIALTSTKVLALLTFAAIGVVAMSQPQQHGTTNSPGQVAAVIGFCFVATLNVGVAIYWRIVRSRVNRRGIPATDLPVIAGARR
jgi:hypothetical protein